VNAGGGVYKDPKDFNLSRSGNPELLILENPDEGAKQEMLTKGLEPKKYRRSFTREETERNGENVSCRDAMCE
jgi:hypothetical protein